jgi:hypothetical protein
MHKKITPLLSALLIILLFQAVVVSQKATSPDKYKPRTLSEVIELNRDGTDQILKKAKLEDRHGFIGIDPFYSKVRLQYIGTPRAISPVHQGLMKTWAKLQRVDKKFSSLYENEYLFKEGDVEYWIPVQKDASVIINEKLKSGEMLNLYVIYVGAQKEPNEKSFKSLFLSTAFEQ